MKRNRLLDAEFYYGTTPEILLRAAQLRHNMTDTEKILWEKLKKKKTGFTFRRQHPVNLYIADFYCHKARLAIEVDGSIHDIIDIKIRDQGRQDEFGKYGILTLRFTNDEVKTYLDDVVKKMQTTCLERIRYEQGLKSPHLGGFRGAILGFRGANLLKSISSFLVAAVFRKPFVFGMPPAVGVELTNHCNLKCPECPSGSGAMKRERGFMNLELFQQIIGELRPYLWNVNLYFQGEPMMHPQFFDFLRESESIQTTISTNGHFIDDRNAERLAMSGLSKLIISLDGLDQETYSKYRRNGDISKVKQGIRDLSVAMKKYHSKMNVEIQMLVNRYNENQIDEMKEFARESGAGLVLKSMQIYEQSSYSEWMPANKKYRRYSCINGTYRVKSSLPRRCARLWFNPVITWNGKVLPCCFDKDADHVMGDLGKESFREIWHGEKFQQFRNDVLHGREKIPVCRNCTSGLRVIL